MTTALTPIELSDLARYETIIQTGIETFVAVGRALREIHDRKLYRQTHTTWEAYCLDRWEFSKQHAGRLVQAAEIMGDLGYIECKDGQYGSQTEPNGLRFAPPPVSERVVRPLAPLPPPVRREVWEQATAEAAPGKPTAAAVDAIARKALAGLSPEKQAACIRHEEEEAAAEEAKDAKPCDELRQVVRVLKHARKAMNPADVLARNDPELYAEPTRLLRVALEAWEALGDEDDGDGEIDDDGN